MNKAQAIFAATCLIGLAFQPTHAQGQFFGNVRLLRTFTGTGTFGWEVDTLEDITGDGIPEFIIPAPFGNPPRVFIYNGATGTIMQTFSGAAGSSFGYGVADAGDVDGDGSNDIIISATAGGAGQVFVYGTGPGFPLLHTLTGEAVGDTFGSAVFGAGDVDGDGLADLLVGAELNGVNGANSGRVYVYSGADGTLIHAIDGPGLGSLFGAGAAPIKDVNGDGIADHIIGARGVAPDGQQKAYVHSGSDGQLLFEMIADAGARSFGQFFVADLGDVDGDGTNDIYVGDFSHLGSQGRAYVFSGKDGSRLWTFPGGPAEGAGTGHGAGDVNNDGFADIMVGHWTSPAGGQGAGNARVYSGKDGSILTSFTSQSPGENFGFDAVGVGDIDGDGMDDYLITAATLNRVYLIAGKVERQDDPEPPPFAIGAFISGSWFDATHAGEGFLIEIINATMAVVYWFTYDEAGNQRWFFGVGTIDGTTIQVDELFVSAGGVFGPAFDPVAVVFTVSGSLTLEINSCDSGKATYTINGVEGMQDLARITSLPGIGCDDAKTGISAGISGSWFDSSHDGEGFLIEVLDENTVLVYWFSYDDKGNQAWFVGVGAIEDKSIVIEEVFMPIGGLFGPNFDPATVELIPWGEIRFDLSCEGGNMTYNSLLEHFGKGGLDAVERITELDGLECE